MDTLPLKYRDWSDRLAMDLALLLEGSGDTLDSILSHHGIDVDDLGRYNGDRVFLRKISHLRNEVREHGMTFRLKARAQAEELLTTSWTLIHSPDVSAAVKADLIKSTVKWGDLEPRKDAVVGVDASGGVSITINLGELAPQSQPGVIEHVK